MEVIGHSKAFWFLLRDEGRYFLDVNSGNSFVGYSISFELSSSEIEKYLEGSDEYITELARRVNDVQRPFIDRSLEKIINDRIHKSIMAWNASQKL